MIADGASAATWKTASSNGHIIDLMRGVRYLGKHPALQQELAAPILAVANDTSAGDARVQALGTLGWTRRDAATFDRLAQEVSSGADAQRGAGGVAFAPGVS